MRTGLCTAESAESAEKRMIGERMEITYAAEDAVNQTKLELPRFLSVLCDLCGEKV